MKVAVDFGGDEAIQTFEVAPLPTETLGFAAQQRYASLVLVRLRQQIAEQKGIPVLEQDLQAQTPGGNASIGDSLASALFPKFTCQRRTRNASNSVDCTAWTKKTTTVAVDKNDTLLDLKFILAQAIGYANPEHLNFVVDFSQRLLNNAQLLSDMNLINNNVSGVNLHYWYELPSDDSNPNAFIARSVPELMGPDERFPTVGHYFRYCMKEFANENHMGVQAFNSDGTRGDYEWLTFSQVNQAVTDFAAGAVQLGMEANNSSRIGICSENRPEWMMTDYACQVQGMVAIPLYDTLAKNAIEYIVNHAGIQLVVCTVKTLPAVVEAKPKCPTLKYIVLADSQKPDLEFIQNNPSAGFTHTYSQVQKLGRANPIPDNYAQPEDLSVICYTSGTTGDPKGAMLAHSTIITGLVSINSMIAEHFTDDVEAVISYLPLAHIYEKLVELSGAYFGISIGYWRGDTLTLLEDIQKLKPTFFPGVPRVYQKFQDKIMAGVSSSNFIRRWLFETAMSSKEAALKNGTPPNSLFEKLVFSKVKEAFGGNIKGCVSGSAPLSSSCAKFLRVAFADKVGEGYGLTETVAGGTGTLPEDCNTYSHVGAPSCTVELKLVDVPDMSYHNSDGPEPRGEIYMRGGSIFKGYYKNPEKTGEVLTADGWFATGDVGKWRLDGKLQIIDRAKNIFKLAQGEYVRPEYVENVYKLCPAVGNIFVHGDSDQTYLVGIVFPDPEVVTEWAKNQGLQSIASNWPELCKHKKVKDLLLSQMKSMAKREQLTGFEQVKKIHVIDYDFTPENGILTPSMKLKRPVARKLYQNEIAAMYGKAPLPSKL